MTPTENTQPMMRREWLFIVLAGFFITNAVTAELISNKLIDVPFSFYLGDKQIGPFTTVIGVVLWPVIFLVTDLINEFYGPKVIRRLSWITSGLIAYCFIVVFVSMAVPANTQITPDTASDAEFNKVFGQSQFVIIGSIVAFMFSQLLDATLFAWIKHKTGNKYIWLRSTGSTVVSQLFDSFIVLYIGFIAPGTIPLDAFWGIAFTNYSLKLLIAIALTPMIYLTHAGIRKYLHNAQ
jgi:queuosine precursor transporter